MAGQQVLQAHRGKKIVTLAVERIRHAARLPQRFEYPARYSPQQHTEGIFGIIEGPEVRVELLIMNPATEAYLAARRIHPTQRFQRRRDGKAVLSMRVRGTEQLRYWILGFGPYVQVLQPPDLRAEIAAPSLRWGRCIPVKGRRPVEVDTTSAAHALAFACLRCAPWRGNHRDLEFRS